MLTRAGLNPGETVLITGASGGVGSAAVQLAKAQESFARKAFTGKIVLEVAQ